MWRRNKAAEEAQAKAIKNRFAVVLGLDLEGTDDGEPGSGARCQNLDELPVTAKAINLVDSQPSSAGLPAQPLPTGKTSARGFKDSGIETLSDISEIEALSVSVQTGLRRLSQSTADSAQEPQRVSGQSVAEETAFKPRIAPAEASKAEVQSLEACYPPQTAADAGYERFSRKCEKLAEKQANIFGDMLTRIGEKTLTQTQATLHRTMSRFESYFAQAEELKSTLEATLTLFSDRTEQAAQTEMQIFEEKVAKHSELAISRVEEDLRNEVAKLQRAAALLVQEQIASMGENLAAQVKENLEAWSTSHLETIQQETSNFSADLVSRIRAESEQRIVAAIHGKLQKIADEFHLLIERSFA